MSNSRQKKIVFPDLKGQVVLITGGASGIGAGLVKAFIDQKCKVYFLDNDFQRAKKLLKKVNSKKLFFFHTNLENIEELKFSIAKIISEQSRLDILINNVANDQRHTLLKTTPEVWDNSLAINLRSCFFSIQAVVKSMIKNGQGKIINFSSNNFLLGVPGYSAYLTAKAGIVALTKSLSKELGCYNIRVNAILPGWVMTEKQKKLWANPQSIEKCLNEQSLKRLIQVEDIIEPTLFFSSQCSAMITGQSLVVDGGRV